MSDGLDAELANVATMRAELIVESVERLKKHSGLPEHLLKFYELQERVHAALTDEIFARQTLYQKVSVEFVKATDDVYVAHQQAQERMIAAVRAEHN